jgi:hypothetical protein
MIPMLARLRDLRARRVALVACSGAQRDDIAGAAAPFTRRIALADRLIARLREHPLLAGAAAAAIAYLGPRKVLAWAARGLAAYSFIRR